MRARAGHRNRANINSLHYDPQICEPRRAKRVGRLFHRSSRTKGVLAGVGMSADTARRSACATSFVKPLGTLLGDAFHHHHVDAVRAAGADQEPVHRDARTGQRIQTGEDELERHRAAA
jgi:hypothetical protein